MTFKAFLEGGTLGPLRIGSDLQSVWDAFGMPSSQSRKKNPLILKYGDLEAALLRTTAGQMMLISIEISTAHGVPEIPAVLDFSDLTVEVMYEANFSAWAMHAGLVPSHVVPGAESASQYFSSGAKVEFQRGIMSRLSLSEKDTDVKPVIGLTVDVREAATATSLSRLKEAENALRQGMTESALLMAWAALESSLRRSARAHGREGVGIQASRLIAELVTHGSLTRDERDMLEEARRLRSGVAHGLEPDALPDSALVQALIEFSKRRLAG